MTKRLVYICCLATLLATPASADFWDEGLVNGATRSDFNDPAIGTSAMPLDVRPGQCPFSSGQFFPNCSYLWPASAWDEWQQSNWTSWNGGDVAGNFWVISANNEPAHGQSPSGAAYSGASGEGGTNLNPNPGPPNQSLPVYLGGATDQIMRLWFTDLANGSKRVNMTVDHRSGRWERNPQGPTGLPFLGFGAYSFRGNGVAIANLNTGPNKPMIRFTARKDLHEVDLSENRSLLHYLVQMLAEWNGEKYLVQFPMFYDGLNNGEPFHTTGGEMIVTGGWNWPYADSYYYPGAHLITFDPVQLSNQCPAVNIPTFTGANWESINYELDVQAIFACLQAQGVLTVPSSGAFIRGFHVANELTGKGAFLRTSIQGLRVDYVPK